MPTRKYSDEQLEVAVKKSFSFAGVLRELDLKQAGGTQKSVKEHTQRLGLDIGHFTGQGHNRDKLSKPISELKSKCSVRRRLIQKRGNVCESCNLSLWLNREIKLEVHHINGKSNEENNLKLLCPNCHSFTDNWRTK